MRLDSDDFTLFGLPARFRQDRELIDRRWRELQAEVHPDRFAAQGQAAQRVAMQWAVRVNEAYRRLKDPLQRAVYLCELRGAHVDAENNTAMPPAFLMQQMEWREALDDAPSLQAVEALQDDVGREREARIARVAQLLDDEGDAGLAAREARALMFIERFADDVDRRLEALGQ